MLFRSSKHANRQPSLPLAEPQQKLLARLRQHQPSVAHDSLSTTSCSSSTDNAHRDIAPDMTTNGPYRNRGQSAADLSRQNSVPPGKPDAEKQPRTVSNGTQTPDSSSIDEMAGTALPDHRPSATASNGLTVQPFYPYTHRRPSAPMMPPFMVSAPGKVIV